MPITDITFSFLDQVVKNNSREWFEANRDLFEASKQEVKSFHAEVENNLSKHDQIAKGRVYRIYRDVRFAKNKTPYKNNWGGGFQRATHFLRGGYYYQIQPGNSFAAGGFFSPNPQDLLHIRKQISQEPDSVRAILADADFLKIFGSLRGEQVKTSPKGFSADDPAIDLLRYKQFIVEHHFTDAQVLKPDFANRLDGVFGAMRPYFDYMSELLTTDLNGESLLES